MAKMTREQWEATRDVQQAQADQVRASVRLAEALDRYNQAFGTDHIGLSSGPPVSTPQGQL